MTSTLYQPTYYGFGFSLVRVVQDERQEDFGRREANETYRPWLGYRYVDHFLPWLKRGLAHPNPDTRDRFKADMRRALQIRITLKGLRFDPKNRNPQVLGRKWSPTYQANLLRDRVDIQNHVRSRMILHERRLRTPEVRHRFANMVTMAEEL